MNWAAKAWQAVLPYAGLFLVILLCTEEGRRLAAWFWRISAREPRFKLIFYPLAALLMVGAAALIAHSVLTLFTTVFLAYE